MALTGFDEEPVFRGLLVGMLTVLIPGRVRLGSFEIAMGGVIMALLFGAAHYQTFFVDPLHLAIAQQLYAFVFGLTYVWLMERSKSLLAPIVAHGLGDALEVAAVIGLMIVWG
jgi:membrane protease YdiL (CAAX protease family)